MKESNLLNPSMTTIVMDLFNEFLNWKAIEKQFGMSFQIYNLFSEVNWN